MPRTARFAPGGVIFHVLNRGVGRSRLFAGEDDYHAFLLCLRQTLEAVPMRVLTYCVMPNHWHLLLWPEHDGDLSRFMMRLTNRHVRRWLTAHRQVGRGHLYQGRYKSFACQDDEHLLTVGRYVDRNAVRAKLVTQAQSWPWCGVGQDQLASDARVPLADWPIARGDDWLDWVNQPQTTKEQQALSRCIQTQRPYGSEAWITSNRTRLGWTDPRSPGRPKKQATLGEGR